MLPYLLTVYSLYYNASVNSHSKLSAYSKETHTWISAINGAMKHVPHTCLFGYG